MGILVLKNVEIGSIFSTTLMVLYYSFKLFLTTCIREIRKRKELDKRIRYF